MKYSTTNLQGEERSCFRCPVVGEKGKAVLRVGLTNIEVTVMEASISGYTITAPAKYARKLSRKRKKDWLIKYDETKALVRAESFAKPVNGLVRVGLLQTKDLTKPEKIQTTLWSRLKPTFGDSTTASVAYGGFVLLLFAAMALPGLGDRLGTSRRIQKTFHWVLKNADQQADVWTR